MDSLENLLMKVRDVPGVLIRAEEEGDRRAAEEAAREAFWNRYAPGASEHHILHLARKRPGFEKRHSLVAAYDGEVIGQALLVRSEVEGMNTDGKAFFTLGPICVLPACSGRGIGSMLMKAALLGARAFPADAVFLAGDPAYYSRFGFRPASLFGIRLPGLPPEEPAAFFMALPLYEGALEGVQGLFRENAVYEADEKALAEYDSGFPKRRKLRLPGQLR